MLYLSMFSVFSPQWCHPQPPLVIHSKDSSRANADVPSSMLHPKTQTAGCLAIGSFFLAIRVETCQFDMGEAGQEWWLVHDDKVLTNHCRKPQLCLAGRNVAQWPILMQKGENSLQKLATHAMYWQTGLSLASVALEGLYAFRVAAWQWASWKTPTHHQNNSAGQSLSTFLMRSSQSST